MGNESESGSLEPAAVIIFGIQELRRSGLTGRIDHVHFHNSAFGKPDFHLSGIRAPPTERIEDDHRHPFPASVNARNEVFPPACDHLLRQTLREIVAAHGILVHVVGHNARCQIVGLVEEHRFPGTPKHLIACRIQAGFRLLGSAKEVRQRAQFFGRQQ